MLYAHLASGPEPDTVPDAAVALASPVIFPEVASLAYRWIGRALLAVPATGRVPVRPSLGALWHVLNRTRALRVGMNPANVDRRRVARALRRSLSNVSHAKLRQMAAWSLAGTFASADGRIDYRAGLGSIGTPMLLVAGAVDLLATPDSVRMAHTLLPGGRNRMVVAGREGGTREDYGHVDLVLGERAPEEIFPLVTEWLDDALGGTP